jgi:hypothetical protein
MERFVNAASRRDMMGKKTNTPKKNGTLRPWLVDVVVDNIR